MPTCPQCSIRKAKRSCPALARSICPPCCAEYRMIELSCPETCAHLKEARWVNADKRLPKLMQHFAAQHKQELFQSVVRFEVLLFLLERSIVEVQRHHFRDLDDGEVFEGVQNALKTYETLDHGIIYEHASESPRVQAVTRAILKAMEDVKQRLQEQQQSSMLKTRDVLTCLQFIGETIQYDRQSGKGSRAWVHNATLYQPYPEQETKLLIIPG